ncbi:hypothetical protein J6590_014974, partial [Homalodisca vitripennis]
MVLRPNNAPRRFLRAEVAEERHEVAVQSQIHLTHNLIGRAWVAHVRARTHPKILCVLFYTLAIL